MGGGLIEYRWFNTYKVYEDGSVYSTKSNKFLRGGIVCGYIQYTLQIKKQPRRYKAHRLVAELFLVKPESGQKLIINHKDGNKLNNHYSNLEWCTYDYNNYHARINGLNDVSKSNSKRWEDDDFRERTSKNISNGIIASGCTKGRRNGRFRYEIFDCNGKEFTRETLKTYLGLSQSFTDKLIHDAAIGIENSHFKEHGIIVNDIKSEVNRLSKPADNEKDVA